MMLDRRAKRCEGRWDMVKAGSRRIPKRSCSQASMSSARLIFLWTIENLTSGYWLATTWQEVMGKSAKSDFLNLETRTIETCDPNNLIVKLVPLCVYSAVKRSCRAGNCCHLWNQVRKWAEMEEIGFLIIKCPFKRHQGRIYFPHY